MNRCATRISGGLLPVKSRRIDRWLLGAVLLLAAWGLLVVYSSSSALGLVREDSNDLFYLQSQLVRCLLGLGLLLALSQLDARHLTRRVRWVLWGGVVILLLILFLPWGPGVETHGTKRWMRVFGRIFQPSEFARIAMILQLAGMLSRPAESLKSWRALLPAATIVLITAGLIAAEPHMSLGLLTALGGFGLIFLAGASLWKLTVVGVVGVATATAVALVAGRGYILTRVVDFLSSLGGDPGFQAKQSMLAIGSGGLLGRGLGRGLQKYFFLPDPHTDFILSIVVEELGFLGLLALFLLTGFILLRIFLLGTRCSSRFGELLCYGVGLHMLLAFLLHTAVCLGWAPITGVPYPLVSFGGSALVANLIALGLVLSVSGRKARVLGPRGAGWTLLLDEPALGRAMK